MPLSLPHADIVLDLFEQYYHRVYCFCRRSLTPDGSEDIAQEVFTRLLQIERLPEMSISVSYLIKIADNLIKRRYNRNQRFQRFLEANDSRMDDASGDSWDGLDTEELSDDVNNRLDQLSDDERNAVELVVCHGLSYQEAAHSMGVPVSTVNNW
ncbi:MAG: sigma-70 family RNA polymerase sigma factor, partial [Phycisphaerales bacterium]|nr:sigma-70 family RNA polymerase sigma factor [Phycisphaerales bacterium]